MEIRKNIIIAMIRMERFHDDNPFWIWFTISVPQGTKINKDNIKYYQYKHIGSLLKDVKNTGSNMWNFPQRAWPISLFSCLFGFRIIIMGLSIKIKYFPLEKSKYSSIPFFWNIPLIPTFCSLFLNFLRLWLYRCTFSDLLSGSKHFF